MYGALVEVVMRVGLSPDNIAQVSCDIAWGHDDFMLC